MPESRTRTLRVKTATITDIRETLAGHLARKARITELVGEIAGTRTADDPSLRQYDRPFLERLGGSPTLTVQTAIERALNSWAGENARLDVEIAKMEKLQP